MPKEHLEIRDFKGVYGSADARDLTPGFAAYAEDLDPVNKEGVFTGLPADTDTGASGIRAHVLCPFEDGTKVAMVRDTTGSGNYSVSYLSNVGTGGISLNDVSSITAGSRQSVVSEGAYVHIGCGNVAGTPPKWLGNIGGYTVEDAELKAPSVSVTIETTTSTTDEPAPFADGQFFIWAYSFIYDGNQEGPLTVPEILGVNQFIVVTPEEGYEKVDLSISVTPVHNRCTHLRVYRSESDKSIEPATFYYVADIDVSGGAGTYELTDTGFTGNSYEQNTGVLQSLEHMTLHWAVATAFDGYHYVADCYNPDLPDARYRIFRSKYNRFDTFDWAVDSLLLPTKPVALAFHANYLWAFSPGVTYAITPDLALAETYVGMGALHQKCVFVTERGMIFCNAKNIWLHDGSGVQPIGQPILYNDEVSTAGWLDSPHSEIPTVGFSPQHDSFTINYGTSTNGNRIWMYNVPSNVWVVVRPPVDAVGCWGAFVGAYDGELYYSYGSIGTLYKMFDSATKRDWLFVSQTLAPEGAWRVKWYDVYISGSNVTTEYSENGAAYAAVSLSLTETGSGVYKGVCNSKPGGAWKSVRDFRIKLTGDVGESVDEISLNYRRMLR